MLDDNPCACVKRVYYTNVCYLIRENRLEVLLILIKLQAMKYFLQNILLEIHNKENKISAQSKRLIDEAYEMTLYLQDLLFSVKKYIIEEGFKNDAEEIHFFHTIKPQILGKLIFYNKVFK